MENDYGVSVMNELDLNELQSAEDLFENGQYDIALKKFEILAEKYPEDGRIAFDLAQIALSLDDTEMALQFSNVAINNGFVETSAFLFYANLNALIGDTANADENYAKAVSSAEDEDEKWYALQTYAQFLISHGFQLKAEKICKILMRDYPTNYQGFHLYYFNLIERGNMDVASQFLKEVPECFTENQYYLADVIYDYRVQSKDEELLELFETDKRFMNNIPEITLKTKVMLLKDADDVEPKYNIIRELIEKYDDEDAVLASMMLEFSKQNYQQSAKIADIIMEKEKDTVGIRFYLAIYIQMFNVYFLCDRKPNEAMQEWITTAGNWCLNFITELEEPKLYEEVKESIYNLFAQMKGSNEFEADESI